MNNKSIMRAIAEAERFLEKARVSAKCPVDQWQQMETGIWSKIHASTKRASMDLSRCLADLRQNR
ncbi:hypothetical protein D4S03_10175 [bacterium]|nr:MAG: hypothetical protein D4S03_10175 [bacterium]